MSKWIAFQIAGDEGQALVFLHGIGGDAESWRLQLDAFAGDYRAIAWDMPGYGDSAPLAEMAFPALVDAVLALLDRLSLERVHLIGHSLGGMIAQAFALAHPERLRSLTLAATSAAFGKRAGGEIASDWQERFIEQRLGPLDRGASMAELAPKLVQGLVGDDPDPKGLELAILSMAAVPEAGYRAAVHCLAGFDQEASLPEIRTPTLLIAGEKDPVAPPRVMARMAKAMSDARFDVIEGSGHLLHLERSEAFNGLLGRFLQRLAVH
ncbi:MAG: alpha/beta fold hydrolase [Alphaproteobacteria bacterium]